MNVTDAIKSSPMVFSFRVRGCGINNTGPQSHLNTKLEYRQHHLSRDEACLVGELGVFL